MNIFVDTSGLLAVLDADDNHHMRMKKEWEAIISSGDNLVSNNYVLVETFALVQHRLGIEAVRALVDDILPILDIEWIDAASHTIAVSALLTASKRDLSFVDCASFETMRRRGLKMVFTLDAHFHKQGFTCIPRR